MSDESNASELNEVDPETKDFTSVNTPRRPQITLSGKRISNVKIQILLKQSSTNDGGAPSGKTMSYINSC